MKKVGIIGAGITGLSLGRLLQDTFDVELLEAKSVCGGIARTKEIDGVAYHLVGGHCFNSKHPEVLDFVFNKVLPKTSWNSIKRISKIRMHNHEVSYPIEFSMKEIYAIDPELAIKMTADLLNAFDDGVYSSLEEWFVKKFGCTLAQKYFLPYNKKIWKRDPKEMNPAWVIGKLPIPDKKMFFQSLITNMEDSMPHSQFYYPKSNNQNTFINALAETLNVVYNESVRNIRYDKNTRKWWVNECYCYDILINTSPLDLLPSLIEDVPQNVLDAAQLLKYNGISNILWRTQETEKTWTYLPGNESIFHRYIHIGTYFDPHAPYSISESIGSYTFEELKANGAKDPFLIDPIAYNQSEHAYVVFDDNYDNATSIIKEYLKEIGLYTVGRFGEWEYYNMDICIRQSMLLSEKLKTMIDIS